MVQRATKSSVVVNATPAVVSVVGDFERCLERVAGSPSVGGFERAGESRTLVGAFRPRTLGRRNNFLEIDDRVEPECRNRHRTVTSVPETANGGFRFESVRQMGGVATATHEFAPPTPCTASIQVRAHRELRRRAPVEPGTRVKEPS